jgi:hypothetical protein
VNEVLAAEFKGKPISENNLSEWRKGGYADWLLVKLMAPETRVSEVLEMSPDLIGWVQGGLTDRLAVMIASRMMVQLKNRSLCTDSDAEAKLWRQLHSGLASLKRYEYFTAKAMKDDAREREAKNGQDGERKPRSAEETRRAVARILGIDPDGPRINPETDLFEGPGAEALNVQREKLKAEDRLQAEEDARREQAYKAQCEAGGIQLNPG